MQTPAGAWHPFPGGQSGITAIGKTDRSNYACARVVASRDRLFREGDVIACQARWQDYQVISSDNESVGYGPANAFVRAANGTNAQMNYVFRPEMVETWSPEILMDIFGTSGMTAYFGVRSRGPIMPKDNVLVSGTSGSVGSIAAQLAKVARTSVIGLASGPERCQWVVDTLGIDACSDYRATDLEAKISQLSPKGIDVFIDGVGDELTTRILRQMNRNGRFLAYGSAAAFYEDDETGLARHDFPSLRRAFGVSEEAEQIAKDKNIKIECWIAYDFYFERIAAGNELSRLLLNGLIRSVINLVEGFEKLPDAIIGMYANPRAGKTQVKFV